MEYSLFFPLDPIYAEETDTFLDNISGSQPLGFWQVLASDKYEQG